MANVLVVAEHQDGKLRKVTLPTITFGRQAAEVVGGEVHVLVLGHGVDQIAEEVAKYGDVAKVHYGSSEAFEDYTAESFGPAIAQVAEQVDAEIIAGAASAQGTDYLPRVAVALEAGMVTNAIKVWDEDGVLFQRPMLSGSVLETVRVHTPRKVVAVRTTDFDDAAEGDAAPVETVELGEGRDDVESAAVELVKSERPELTDAEVVIAGGRGLKSGDAFGMLEELADLFGGAVGASRAAVDSGYAPTDWQIGQTGKVVAPNLYVAIAISGAIQHLSGMKGSKTIVAINKDPEAPIFQVADYGLVADAFNVVPELTEKLKSMGLGG
ncbi:MAG: electron transfer flavoprotein subunit alpha/FixB family protein [Persicimonas sp.]